MELYEGVGVSFAAIGKDSIGEVQVGSIYGKVCSIHINLSQTFKLI